MRISPVPPQYKYRTVIQHSEREKIKEINICITGILTFPDKILIKCIIIVQLCLYTCCIYNFEN